MVASPEISRANGRKSRGPVTEMGKAIASKNATKHGLLSQKPPLVIGEDLESFQGIMQGLLDEYQPQTPTEHLLVQQIAMGWLRLHRLWGVEAAIANVSILQQKMEQKYPEQPILDLAALEHPSPKTAAEKAELSWLKQEINQTALASLAIPNIEKLEKLSRYERHLTKQLYDALNRLQEIQKQRQQADFMGSFG